MGYLFVKDMLGDDLVFQSSSLLYYISQWHGKHPHTV